MADPQVARFKLEASNRQLRIRKHHVLKKKKKFSSKICAMTIPLNLTISNKFRSDMVMK